MSAPPALTVDGASKSWGAVTALDGVDVTVRSSTVHCLLGENGAGKSTLCRGIFGLQRFDTGTMSLGTLPYAPASPAQALGSGVAMVHQHFNLVPELTVGENLSLGQGWTGRARRRVEGSAREVADEHGLLVDLAARTGDLSVGQQQQVEIVRCLVGRPSLLLLDEPTAVLDPVEVAALLRLCRTLADAGAAVVLITHKLSEVLEVADDVTVLRAGAVASAGPLAGRGAQELVTDMVGGRPPSPGGRRAAGCAAAPLAAPAALSARGLRLGRALDGVDLEVRPGEVVGLAGVEGNGQSELAAVLTGARAPDGGSVQVAGRDTTRADPGEVRSAGLGVVPEDRLHEGCIPALSVAENLLLPHLARFTRLGRLDRAALERAALPLIEAHDIRCAGPRAPMSTLSGGNQQKVVLARELSTTDPLRAVVAVHPTRGLDVGAVAAVLDRLAAAAAAGAGVLLVSSELAELVATCTRLLVLYRGRIVGEVDPAADDATARAGALMAGAAAASRAGAPAATARWGGRDARREAVDA